MRTAVVLAPNDASSWPKYLNSAWIKYSNADYITTAGNFWDAQETFEAIDWSTLHKVDRILLLDNIMPIFWHKFKFGLKAKLTLYWHHGKLGLYYAHADSAQNLAQFFINLSDKVVSPGFVDIKSAYPVGFPVELMDKEFKFSGENRVLYWDREQLIDNPEWYNLGSSCSNKTPHDKLLQLLELSKVIVLGTGVFPITGIEALAAGCFPFTFGWRSYIPYLTDDNHALSRDDLYNKIDSIFKDIFPAQKVIDKCKERLKIWADPKTVVSRVENYAFKDVIPFR